MTEKIVCPKRCNGGYASRVKKVPYSNVGITPPIAKAAQLMPDEKVFTCDYCSCVWSSTFDLNFLRDRIVILGEYGGPSSANAFLPEPWLETVIDKHAGEGEK